MRYDDQEDYLLYVLLSRQSRKLSGSGVQWLLFGAVVFVLWLLCR